MALCVFARCVCVCCFLPSSLFLHSFCLFGVVGFSLELFVVVVDSLFIFSYPHCFFFSVIVVVTIAKNLLGEKKVGN